MPVSQRQRTPKGGRKSSQDLAELRASKRVADELGKPARKMDDAEAAAHEAWRSRDRRARYGQLPKPPEAGDVEVLYAKLRQELSHLNNGEMVMTVIDSDAWQSTVGERCRELDALASTRRRYTHEECERALLYQRLLGKRTYEAAHKDLCSASAEGVMTRATLDFDHPRDHVGPNRRLKHPKNRRLDGVPSAATVCRHRTTRFPEQERADLYAECFIRMVEEHLVKFPEFQEEMRVIGFDGSTHKTVYRPRPVKDSNGKPVIDPATGKTIQRITGWEGGSLTAESAPESKRGHGFLTTTGHTGGALPISARFSRIHDSEVEGVLSSAREDLPRLRARMDGVGIGVATMDGAFAGPRVRAAMRENGYIENTHRVAHGDGPATERNLTKRLATAIPIDGYPNWRANGLRELFCMCGHGNVFTRPKLLKTGVASVALEGTCKTCGDISVTSGDWRRVQNPDRYVRINPNDNVDVENADLLLGNPLTHGDKRAQAYGFNRYAQGEGLHGTATTRWNLFKDRAYYRRLDQARLDVLLTYCLMHGLAMESRRQKATAPAPSPTPLHPPGAPPAAPPVAVAA